MADEIDIANQAIEEGINRSIYQVQQKANSAMASKKYCIDCDAEIPEARRLTVKGCQRCAVCQSKHETKQRTVFNRAN